MIVTKGRSSAIFVFFAFSGLTNTLMTMIRGAFGINAWNTSTSAWQTIMVTDNLLTIVIFAVIGILVLRKQDL
ncbi:MAG: hypothetical protein FWE07_07080 [Turicibacter sp.]|nr:hypothetical protein [Turicibacter sp.]